MSKASDNEQTLPEQQEERDLAIQLQLKLLTMQQIAPYINLLGCLNQNGRSSSAAKDFATSNVLSEAMHDYLTNPEAFFRKVLEPLQALSRDDLMEQIFPKIAARDASAEADSVEPIGEEAKDADSV